MAPTWAASPVPETPHYGAQTKARKVALDLLFAADQRGQSPLETLRQARQDGEVTLRDLTVTLVEGVCSHLGALDARISEYITGSWSLERMPSVDRCLARIAVFEIDHTDVPNPTAISEAVRLAGDLSTDASPGFLNGLLRAIAATPPTHS